MGFEFEFDGRVWQYDPEQIDVKSAVIIKEHTGKGLRSWSQSIDDWDPQAVQALYWVVKRQNDEACDIAGLNFNIADFMTAFEQPCIEWNVRQLTKRLTADPPEAEADTSTLESTPTSAT